MAELEINKGDLRLPRPGVQGEAGSLLGGDAGHWSAGEPLPQDAPFPVGQLAPAASSAAGELW